MDFNLLKSKLNEAYLRNWAAPQSGEQPSIGQYFQYRKTGVPGEIVKLPGDILGQHTYGTLENNIQGDLARGPKTGIETIEGLIKLQQFFKERGEQNPGEGKIYIDPQVKQEPLVYLHEAGHSLYDQLRVSKYSNEALGNLADKLKIAYQSESPELNASEATASALTMPSPSSDYYINEVANSGSQESNKIKQKLLKLYKGNK